MPSSVTLRRTRSGPSMANAWLVLSSHLGRGVLAFRDVAGGRTLLREAAPAVEFADGRTAGSLGRGFDAAWRVEETSDTLGSGLTLRLSTPPAGDEPAVHLAVTLYGDQPFAVVQIELSLRSPRGRWPSARSASRGASP
jgi:hypothetical protein